MLTGPLYRMQIVGAPLSDRKLARSLNDLSKQWKKSFLWEILVCSLITQPSLLWGGKIWHSLKGRWEIIGRSMRSLSAPWVLLEHSLGIHWAFVERSLPLAVIEGLFWTGSKLWGDYGNCGDYSMIINRSLKDLGDCRVTAGRSLKDRWEIWPFFHRSMITQWSLPLCKGGLPDLWGNLIG